MATHVSSDPIQLMVQYPEAIDALTRAINSSGDVSQAKETLDRIKKAVDACLSNPSTPAVRKTLLQRAVAAQQANYEKITAAAERILGAVDGGSPSDSSDKVHAAAIQKAYERGSILPDTKGVDSSSAGLKVLSDLATEMHDADFQNEVLGTYYHLVKATGADMSESPGQEGRWSEFHLHEHPDLLNAAIAKVTVKRLERDLAHPGLESQVLGSYYHASKAAGKDMSEKPHEMGKWSEFHLGDDSKILESSLMDALLKHPMLRQKQFRDMLDNKVYNLAKAKDPSADFSDPKWGENNRTKDALRFLEAYRQTHEYYNATRRPYGGAAANLTGFGGARLGSPWGWAGLGHAFGWGAPRAAPGSSPDVSKMHVRKAGDPVPNRNPSQNCWVNSLAAMLTNVPGFEPLFDLMEGDKDYQVWQEYRSAHDVAKALTDVPPLDLSHNLRMWFREKPVLGPGDTRPSESDSGSFDAGEAFSLLLAHLTARRPGEAEGARDLRIPHLRFKKTTSITYPGQAPTVEEKPRVHDFVHALNLDQAGAAVSLADAIDGALEVDDPERLDAQDRKMSYHEHFQFDVAPEQMVVRLNRHGYSAGEKRKVTLGDGNSFTIHQRHFVEKEGSPKKDVVMEADSYLYHSGGVGGGHWVAFIKQPDGKWMEVNDSRTYLYEANHPRVKNTIEQAALLHFVRKPEEAAPAE